MLVVCLYCVKIGLGFGGCCVTYVTMVLGGLLWMVPVWFGLRSYSR